VPVPPNVSLSEVYARMERALDQGNGRVFHATILLELQNAIPDLPPTAVGAITSSSAKLDLWVDASAGVVRGEMRLNPPSNDAGAAARWIVRKNRIFNVDQDGTGRIVESVTCRGSDSVIIAQLMGCSSYFEKSTTRVESGAYQGHRAVVLVTVGTATDEDSSSPFEERLYLDSRSYLPLSAEGMSKHSPSNAQDSHESRHYEVEFVDRSTLAKDFFEPAAIGYAEADPAANLQPAVNGMRIYWLGYEFAGPAGLSPLSLLQGSATRPVPPYYESVRIAYKLRGSSRGSALAALTLREYPADTLQTPNPYAGGRVFPDQQGWMADVSIQGGRAAIFYDKGSRRYMGQAYFDTTIVLVTDEGATSIPGSRDAMIAILKALRPYQ